MLVDEYNYENFFHQYYEELHWAITNPHKPILKTLLAFKQHDTLFNTMGR